MSRTIATQFTTNLSCAGEDTQLLVDTSHPDWQQSGLRHPSVVLAATTLQLDQSLKAALGIS